MKSGKGGRRSPRCASALLEGLLDFSLGTIYALGEENGSY